MCALGTTFTTENTIWDLSGRWLIRVQMNRLSLSNMLSVSSKADSEFLVVRDMLRLVAIGLSCSYGFMQIFRGDLN